MKKSWRTSLLGGLVMATGIWSLAANPSKKVDEQSVGSIIAGAGLLFAKDHKVTGGTEKQ